jgi:hypothetical protein
MTDTLGAHPDSTTLRLFLLGLLGGPERNQVEGHLEQCAVCCQTALSVPADDRLVRLLRQRAVGNVERRKEPQTP